MLGYAVFNKYLKLTNQADLKSQDHERDDVDLEGGGIAS
jgi:hypothetical protein